MAHEITAKVRVTWIQEGDSGVNVMFSPNYTDPANAAWAQATPTLNLSMVVKDRNLFKTGHTYTLTFIEDGE